MGIDGLVYWVCLADDHAAGDGVRAPLTVRGGQWAFCAAGESDGHDWCAIEGTPSWDLRRVAARVGAERAARSGAGAG